MLILLSRTLRHQLKDFEACESVLFCARGFVVSATATRIKEFAAFGQPCFAGVV